jgi:hypothetical protein
MHGPSVIGLFKRLVISKDITQLLAKLNLARISHIHDVLLCGGVRITSQLVTLKGWVCSAGNIFLDILVSWTLGRAITTTSLGISSCGPRLVKEILMNLVWVTSTQMDCGLPLSARHASRQTSIFIWGTSHVLICGKRSNLTSPDNKSSSTQVVGIADISMT